jgi:hypothetical protein
MHAVFEANKIESAPRVRVPELLAIEDRRLSGDDPPGDLGAYPEMRRGLHFKQKVIPHDYSDSGKANRRTRNLVRKENVGQTGFEEAQPDVGKNLDQFSKSRTDCGMIRKKFDAFADIGWLHSTMTQFHPAILPSF